MYVHTLKLADKAYFNQILKRACKSLQIDFIPDPAYGRHNLTELANANGYGQPRQGFSWKNRTIKWMESKECVFLAWDSTKVYKVTDVSCMSDLHGLDYIPIFPSYGNLGLATTEQHNKTQETPEMKSLFDKVLETNKNEAIVAAKATAGKTANDFIQDKLYKSIPWYARFFTKKKDAKNNALAKLVTANIAVVLSKHFGQNNAKLDYISEAMLSDAMISLTRDSEMLDKFIKELTDTVSVPNDILKNFNHEQDT